MVNTRQSSDNTESGRQPRGKNWNERDTPFSQRVVWQLHLLVKKGFVKHVVVLGFTRKLRLDVD